MPFIPASNVLQVELIYLWAGQTVETVLHYKAPDPISIPDMNTAGAFFVTWYNTSLKPLHHSTIQLTQVKMTDLSFDFAPVVNWGTGLPIVGTVGADGLPNNVALTLTKRTALRGRSYRGRIYHGGMAESQCAGNQIVGATVTSLLSAYAAILALTVGAESWPMVVLSRRHNGADLAAAVATNVVSLSSDGFVDSQRRRLPGRGN